MIEKIKRGLNNPYPFLLRCIRPFARIIPEVPYLKIIFYLSLKYKLNLKNPQSFNEKLQWLKLHDRKSEYINLVDKYEAKNILAKKYGTEFIIPTIGLYNNFNQINIDMLPSQFVIKTTHQSGGVVVCTDKKKFDIEKAKCIINRKLRKNLYYWGLEWPYKYVKPRIIIEEYIGTDSDLKDYKLMCFNGKVRCTFVCSNRNKNLNIDFFDINWNHLPFERHYPASNTMINKPINYNKMISIAEDISKNMRFVRVDFYEVESRLYIGEITFYPGCGLEEFTPQKWDYILGSWINLNYNENKE